LKTYGPAPKEKQQKKKKLPAPNSRSSKDSRTSGSSERTARASPWAWRAFGRSPWRSPPLHPAILLPVRKGPARFCAPCRVCGRYSQHSSNPVFSEPLRPSGRGQPNAGQIPFSSADRNTLWACIRRQSLLRKAGKPDLAGICARGGRRRALYSSGESRVRPKCACKNRARPFIPRLSQSSSCAQMLPFEHIR